MARQTPDSGIVPPQQPLGVEVLLVTRDAADAAALARIFSHSRWQLITCESVDEATQVVRSRPIGVVICREAVNDGTWRELLNSLEQYQNRPKVFVAAKDGTNSLWDEIVKAGADYVLEVPFDQQDVFRSISDAWQRWWYTAVDETRFDTPKPPQRAGRRVTGEWAVATAG